MTFNEEFGIIDLILHSPFETRGVDAFTLSVVRAEKQMRRIFTYLVFQSPTYSCDDYENLRAILANNNRIYFKDFIKAINLILPRTLEEIYGQGYAADLASIEEFLKDRNKIFHGQLTSNYLQRTDLIDRAEHLQKWCRHLGDKMNDEIGYSGFGDSYIKADQNLHLKNVSQFDTPAKYEQFLRTEVQR